MAGGGGDSDSYSDGDDDDDGEEGGGGRRVAIIVVGAVLLSVVLGGGWYLLSSAFRTSIWIIRFSFEGILLASYLCWCALLITVAFGACRGKPLLELCVSTFDDGALSSRWWSALLAPLLKGGAIPSFGRAFSGGDADANGALCCLSSKPLIILVFTSAGRAAASRGQEEGDD